MSILSIFSPFERNVTGTTLNETRATTNGVEYPAIPEEAAPTLVKNAEVDGIAHHLITYDIMIPAIGVLVIVTNLLVVISSGLLLKRGLEPRCTYLLLGNVALADLIAGLTVVINAPYAEVTGEWSQSWCCFHLGTIVSSVVASIYSVALIAVDRFLYILHGLKYHRLVYITRVRSMIVATWFFGVLIGFLPLVGWSGNSMFGKRCWFTMVAPPRLLIVTCIVGTIPVLFITVLYSIILYRAIKKIIQLKGSQGETDQDQPNNATKLRMFRGGAIRISQIETISENVDEADVSSIRRGQQSCGYNPGEYSRSASIVSCAATSGGVFNQPLSPSKWKAIKVVLFTTGSLVFTWLPFFTACTVFVYCDTHTTLTDCRKLKLSIMVPLGFLCFTNSLLNPIIYAWWHNGFRNAIKKMYWKRKKIIMLKNNIKRSQAILLNVRSSQPHAFS